jgi:hypothetical protein
MAYPVVMVLVAMTTANHCLADAVAGLVVLLLGHAVSTTPTRIATRSVPHSPQIDHRL